MQIIAPTYDDLSALSQLAAETFSETFGHLYPPEDLEAFLARSYNQKGLWTEVSNPDHFWRVVMDNGRAVAYLQCGPVGLPHPDARPMHDGELKRLYVHSSQQGKGLGKHLMALALDHLAERYHSAPQWIGVWSQNLKAQSLYMSYGFAKAGAYQFAVGKTMDDEYILRRIP